jgi:hypothetical protein
MAKASKPIPPRCDGCKHYHSDSTEQGFCRRFPPQVPAMNYAQFPPVKAEWNCGEFARST